MPQFQNVAGGTNDPSKAGTRATLIQRIHATQWAETVAIMDSLKVQSLEFVTRAVSKPFSRY